VDCKKLKKEFPDRKEYECHLTLQGDGFTLQNSGMSPNVIEAELHLHGSCLIVSTGQSRYEIRVEVNHKDELRFTLKHQGSVEGFDTPESLARYFG
jgi:hypothetical protein